VEGGVGRELPTTMLVATSRRSLVKQINAATYEDIGGI
jgi:hypothetical protein